MSQTEEVICLPAPLLPLMLRQGLNRVALVEVLMRTGFLWLPRPEAERTEEYKHLATYAVLTCRGRVFTYRRGDGGGEGRLHGLLSLGVGGHVTRDDLEAADAWVPRAVRRAAYREVNEEVVWDGPVASTWLGLIVDDSNPVGRVHLGVAYRYELADTSATAREDCLADARWVTLDEAREDAESYESWSRTLLEELAR